MATRKTIPLEDAIDRLSQKKRGKGLLDPAAKREGIQKSRAISYPSAQERSGDGIISPLVEQPYTGSTYYSLTSSDGLFVFEIPAETDYIDADGAGNTYTYKHRDPNA